MENLLEAQAKLRLYVTNSKQRLQALLDRLQWTEQGVLKQHRISVENEPKCAVKTQLELPYCNVSKQSLQLDSKTLHQLLGTEVTTPVTFDDLQASFSSSQKLSIYEYVMRHTPKRQTSPVFKDNAAYAEMVAVTKREQNKKRRHRKCKPTLNEELHELIELQMQALMQHLKEQRRQTDKVHYQKPRHDRSRSRGYSKSRHKESHERDRVRLSSRDHKRNKHKSHKTKKHRRSRSRSRSRNRRHH